MAGWIKVESDTADKPEIVIMSRLLNLDRDAVFGKLIRVWGWFDRNSTDGRVSGFVDADVDSVVGFQGFSGGMRAVGWLADTEDSGGLVLPHFERHNAETGKARALKNARQARWRAGVAARAAARLAEASQSTPTASPVDASTGLPERERELDKKEPPLSLSTRAPAVLPAVVEAYVRKFGVEPTNGGLAQLEKITDLEAWREVLDYWAANGHRIQSIGGMVNRYHEQVQVKARSKQRKENEIASSRSRAARVSQVGQNGPAGTWRDYYIHQVQTDIEEMPLLAPELKAFLTSLPELTEQEAHRRYRKLVTAPYIAVNG